MISPGRIRRADTDDVPKVLALERATAEAPHWSEAIYQGYLTISGGALRRALFVAIGEEGLQGFAAASLAAGEAELESMVVDAGVRRSGVGGRLLEAVKQWARNDEAGTLRLEVRSANAPAQAFYRARGFVFEGLRRGYYKAPVEDALLMRLDLAPAGVSEEAPGGGEL